MEVIRFAERELKPYAEPVSTDDLQTGTVYFALNFIDEDMLFPHLEPVVFIGRNLEREDQGRLYFQDLDSHRQGIRYDGTADGREATFNVGSESELNHIFDYERAIDQLMLCSLRRKTVFG